MPDRIILHVDMNAFFASVEQQANPELRGKPIAVIGSAVRTVITTASYEARAYGVKTGMTVYQARRQCPDLVFVTGNNRAYTRISTEIMEILREFTPIVEVFSIDEAFLDLTGSIMLFGSVTMIAESIKKRIGETFGLTCSIGIAPNKLLAKLASEMKKPDGLTVIRSVDIPSVLETMPVGALCGIGRHTERVLSSYGIATCGALGRFPVEILARRFGVLGEKLHFMAQGIDASPVIPEEESAAVQSVGHSMTLATDCSDGEEIRRHLLRLAEMVGRRARRYGIRGKTVTLTIRYHDFTTFSRQKSGCGYSNDTGDIFTAALGLLAENPIEQPVRLLGVRLTNLDLNSAQLSLFEDDARRSRAVAAMDVVNERFGTFTVTYGTLIGEKRGSGVISPAWRPDGVRRVEVS